MKDINDIMPKVPNMRWGALMNKPPTNKKFEEKNSITIDGKEILKKDPNKWT